VPEEDGTDSSLGKLVSNAKKSGDVPASSCGAENDKCSNCPNGSTDQSKQQGTSTVDFDQSFVEPADQEKSSQYSDEEKALNFEGPEEKDPAPGPIMSGGCEFDDLKIYPGKLIKIDNHPISIAEGVYKGDINPFYGWPGHPWYYKLLLKAARIHRAKNVDYGGGNPLGNFMEAEGIGIKPWQGILIRMTDKWARIKNLTKRLIEGGGGPEVKDESIEDTLLDLANYSILAIVVRRHNK
jgi:hypothetical protein